MEDAAYLSAARPQAEERYSAPLRSVSHSCTVSAFGALAPCQAGSPARQ